jgi:hypothetical protein
MMVAKRRVFYSFHFDNDVMRTQQVRNIGVIEGNVLVSANEWETARKTSGGIEKWIDDNMKYKSCVVVLVGTETANRPWVQHEIKKGWNDGKGLLGIYIHNLKDPRYANTLLSQSGKCSQGANPFDLFTINNGAIRLSAKVKCYNPNTADPYNDIANNIENWVEEAIRIRNNN